MILFLLLKMSAFCDDLKGLLAWFDCWRRHWHGRPVHCCHSDLLVVYFGISVWVFSHLPGSDLASPEPVRRIEIWVDDAQWSLMHEDGQLKAAEIRFSNFSYNRELFSDDSGVHRFELGTFNVTNCMPNTPAIYKVGVVLFLVGCGFKCSTLYFSGGVVSLWPAVSSA